MDRGMSTIMDGVEDFIQGRFGESLSKVKLPGGKSMDEMFVIEGIPLFWFYKRYFLSHVLSPPLNTFKELFTAEKLTLYRKTRLGAGSFFLRKYLFFREYRKMRAAHKKNNSTLGRKALFLTYPHHLREGNKLYRLQGIIDILSKDGLLEPFPLFVAQLSSSAKTAPRFHTVYQYCDEEIKAKAERQAEQAADRWKKLKQTGLSGAVSFKSVSLWPYLGPAFSLFMSRELLFITLNYYETFKKIIEKEKVAVTFISGQNGIFERCLAAASRTRGIPCILLPHGFAIGNLPASDVLENMYIPVFNQTTASHFIDSGIPPQQIRVTGPAVYDNIINHRQNTFRVSATNEERQKNLLLLTQPLTEDNFMSQKEYFLMVEAVVREMSSLPDAKIIIKLHPREKGMKSYEKIAKKIDQKKISIYQEGEFNLLYGLLSTADVVVNFYSTAGVLEASILDVPSVTFPFNGKKNNKYGDFDPSLYALDIKELKPAIRRLLDNPALLREKRKKMVQEFCTFTDGKSSERVVQWAYELLKNSANLSTMYANSSGPRSG